MTDPTWRSFFPTRDEAYREAVLRARKLGVAHEVAPLVRRPGDLPVWRDADAYLVGMVSPLAARSRASEFVNADTLLPGEQRCIDCGVLGGLVETRYGSICIPCIDKAYAAAMEEGDLDA